MAYTINGFGTSVCCDDDLGWNGHDAVEWFVAFYLPVVPLAVVHAFDWRGNRFRVVPMKWSSRVVFRTFAHRWCWVFLAIGLLVCAASAALFAGEFGLFEQPEMAPTPEAVLTIGLGFVLVFTILFFVLRCTGGRARDIRRVLGPHELGTADPALLGRDVVAQLVAGGPDLGRETFTEAALAHLAAGEYPEAMWSARLAVAAGEPDGETVTSVILADLGVQRALEEVRHNPSGWGQVMRSRRAVTQEGRDG